MKKLIILSAIAMGGLMVNTADAQIGIHIGFGFAPRRVVYAPAPVIEQAPVYEQQSPVYNNSNDDFYYLPDVGAYYSVNEECYYYFDGDSWVSAAYLPGAYRDYDWRSERRFEVHEYAPYMHNDIYRSRYNGHQVGDWDRSNYINRSHEGYVNAGRYNNQNRDVERSHSDWGQGGYGRSSDRTQTGYSRPSQQNWGQHGYGQPAQSNRNEGGYSRPSDNRSQGGYTRPSHNRGQSGFGQPSQTQRGNGGYGQPSNQNGGRFRNSGANDHYTQMSPKGGFDNHRMARF